jgi:hypothetical protein
MSALPPKPKSILIKNILYPNHTAYQKNSILGYRIWGYKGDVLANMYEVALAISHVDRQNA